MTPTRQSSKAKHFIGAGVTLLCLVTIAHQINANEVLAALNAFRWPYLVLAVIALGLGYFFRILRWSMMLRAAGAFVSWQSCAAPFLGSIALNNVLPLRAGDVIRAFVFPAALGISKTRATSSLLMERLLDLTTLLACLGLGMVAFPQAALPQFFIDIVWALSLIGGSTLVIGVFFSARFSQVIDRVAHANESAKRGRRYEALVALSNVLRDIASMSRPQMLFPVVAISMVVWVAESGLFYFMLRGFDLGANLPVAMFIMAIASLSTLVPSSPGYIGPFHLAAFTGIMLYGGSSAQAVSYAVLTHLALWLPTTAAGAVAIWMKPTLFPAMRMGAKGA